MKKFKMLDLGNLSYFFGMVLYQRKYVKKVLKRFIMLDWNLAVSPIEANLKLEKNGHEDKVDATLFKQIVGSLRYVCNNMSVIGFYVCLVRRYMDDPRVSHMKAARRIMRYLKGTLNCGILFSRNSDGNDAMITCYLCNLIVNLS